MGLGLEFAEAPWVGNEAKKWSLEMEAAKGSDADRDNKGETLGGAEL